jgi:hypothetical protein
MFNYKGNSGTNGLYFDILDKPSKKIKSYQNYWCPPPGIGDVSRFGNSLEALWLSCS